MILNASADYFQNSTARQILQAELFAPSAY